MGAIVQSDQDQDLEAEADDYGELAKCRACGDYVMPDELDRSGLCAGCSSW